MSVRWVELPDGRLMLRYRVDGCGKLAVPGFRGRGRADDLWKTTCFELFLYCGGGCYREFNFSPGGQWALYEFSGYRNAPRPVEPIRTPEIASETGTSLFMQTVFIDRGELERAERAALAAVIEEQGGRPSYWALSHAGLRPDFHDPACFRIPLAPTASA